MHAIQLRERSDNLLHMGFPYVDYLSLQNFAVHEERESLHAAQEGGFGGARWKRGDIIQNTKATMFHLNLNAFSLATFSYITL